MRLINASMIALGAVLALSACQAKKEPPVPVSRPGATGKSAALRSMEQVATAAHKCWFASKDKAFRPYRFANELNSMSGQPRFLLVPVKNFGGLPQLVVQSSGGSGRVEVFGPVLDTKLGPRVQADVARWSAGDNSCSATG